MKKDNKIREKGVKSLSETLKVNTTLKVLHLYREINYKFITESLLVFDFMKTLANDIGTKGSEALSEALKTNTTLTELNLDSYNI